MLNIAVMGAGSVGCYYGGMLARAGHSVVLIGRLAHMDAVGRDGLFMDTQTFQERVVVRASTEAKAVKGAQIVLCCVKSTDTTQAADEMAPFLDSGALVLSLQNGVDNAAQLQARLKQSVAPAVVYVATEMPGPGQVKHHGRGELVIAPGVLSDEQVQAFCDAGVPIRISGNVQGALWAKLILNCAYNALSAITRMPYGQLLKQAGIEEVMRDVVNECLAVAAAREITVPEDTWEAILRIAQTMPGQLSSTAQDLARGKPSEIDHLNGYVVRTGAHLGIATPVNRVLTALVKSLESRCAG